MPEGCDPIFQVGTESSQFAMSAAAFEFEPAAGNDRPEVISVSPIAPGQTPLGTSELVGGKQATVRVFASVDAVTDLINYELGDADGQLFEAYGGFVDIDEATDYGTQFKGFIKGTLSAVVFRELGPDGPIDGGDCLFLAEGVFDTSETTAACDAPTDVTDMPSGGACFDPDATGQACNPMTNEGCDAATEICDFTGAEFICYPIEGDEADLCAPCNAAESRFCKAGLTCDSDGEDGRCYRYCCSDADCGAGNTCISYAYVTNVGVCVTL